VARKYPDRYPNLYDPHAVDLYLALELAESVLSTSDRRDEYDKQLLNHNKT